MRAEPCAGLSLAPGSARKNPEGIGKN